MLIFFLVSCSVQATQIPTALPTDFKPGVGSTMISNTDGMTLMYVPSGEFTMGSKAEDVLPLCDKFGASCPLDYLKNEEPPHTVNLDAFWMDQTEVTNAKYAGCVRAGQCDPPASTKSYKRESYFGDPDFADYPVVSVNWNTAKTYGEWADRRLPTEADWEKAARGEDARDFPWGNDFPNNDLLNFRDFVGDTTGAWKYPMGISPYGALDMAGNVWEWVADWYSEKYYSNSPASNPLGPDSGTERVLRGGGFGSRIYTLRTTFRSAGAPTDAFAWIGFRCTMSANP